MDLEGLEYQSVKAIKRAKKKKEVLAGIESVGYRKIQYTPKQALKNKALGVFGHVMENVKANASSKKGSDDNYMNMVKGNIMGIAKRKSLEGMNFGAGYSNMGNEFGTWGKKKKRR